MRESNKVACQSPLLVREQSAPHGHHLTNGFTLSRPRDFISALTKEQTSSKDCRSDGGSQSSIIQEEKVSTSQTSTVATNNSYDGRWSSSGVSSVSPDSRCHQRVQREDQSSSPGDPPGVVNLTVNHGSPCTSWQSGDLRHVGVIHSDTKETYKGEG